MATLHPLLNILYPGPPDIQYITFEKNISILTFFRFSASSRIRIRSCCVDAPPAGEKCRKKVRRRICRTAYELKNHFFRKFSRFTLAFFRIHVILIVFMRKVSLAFECAPIAQLDRAADYGSAGWEFKSLWVHHLSPPCGRSKMVMLQLPKLATTVRFRSPAPFQLIR